MAQRLLQALPTVTMGFLMEGEWRQSYRMLKNNPERLWSGWPGWRALYLPCHS